jgi:hypothetical protein
MSRQGIFCHQLLSNLPCKRRFGATQYGPQGDAQGGGEDEPSDILISALAVSVYKKHGSQHSDVMQAENRYGPYFDSVLSGHLGGVVVCRSAIH